MSAWRGMSSLGHAGEGAGAGNSGRPPLVLPSEPAMEIDEKDAGRFDETFEPMERKVLPCQETFYIHSHSVVQEI